MKAVKHYNHTSKTYLNSSKIEDMKYTNTYYWWLNARLLMVHLMDMPVSLTTIWQFIVVKAHSKLDSATVMGVEIAANIICYNCGMSSNGDPAGIGCLN